MGAIRRGLAELAVWLLPLIVVAEYVGTTFGNTVVATLELLVLFLGIFWLTPPNANTSSKPWPRVVRVALGVIALAVGLAGMRWALLPVLDPKHNPLPNIGNARVREVFLFAPALFAYPIALSFRLMRGRPSGRDYERLGLFIALGLLAHMVGKFPVQGLPVLPYGRPGLPGALVTAEIALIAIAFVPKVPGVVRVCAVIGAGLGLRYVGLETWQLDPGTRDMLPLVKSAQDAFVAGASPYGLQQMQPGSVVPLTYLPGMWLGFGVPRLFGADIRLWGLIADAAVVGGLYWAASGVRESDRARAQGIALGFGAVWLFSPSLAWNGIYAEPHAWWLWLALVLAATLRKKWWLAACALGVAMATRHFALVVAPFVLLAMLRDLGWRRALPRVAVTGLVTALLLVPFALTDPENFWFGTYRWLVEYGPVHESWFWEKFGFSGPLYKAHATQWMPRAQVFFPLLFLVVAFFVRGRRRVIAPLGSAYVLFVMFNGIIWDSFYLGCSLFAAFAAAGGYELDCQKLTPARTPSRSIFWLSVAGTAAAALAALVLVVSFAHARSDAGRDQARAELARLITPKDVLVDRTDWNVAFVRGKPLFEPRAPAPTGRDPFDPSLGPSGVLGHERAFFAFRSDRDRREQEALATIGHVVDAHDEGRYRVFGLNQLAIASRLSNYPGAGNLRPCRIGTPRQMVGSQPTNERATHYVFTNVKLGRALVIVAGAEDAGMVWGHDRVRVTLGIDSKPVDSLLVPNLPGLHFFAVDTSSLASTHEITVSLTTHDTAPRWFCFDGFIVGT